MKLLSFLALTVLTLFFLSCNNGSGSPTSPGTASDIMPLVTGNYWVYNSYLGNDTASVHNLDSAVVGNLHAIQEVSCYPVFFWVAGNAVPWTLTRTSYRYNRSDGLHTLIDSASTSEVALEVQYPVAVGDNWNVGDYAQMTCQSVTDQVTVPAGTYANCIRNRVSLNNNTRYSIVWYKPGVGEIRQVFYNSLGGIDSLRNLRTYHYQAPSNNHSGENG